MSTWEDLESKRQIFPHIFRGSSTVTRWGFTYQAAWLLFLTVAIVCSASDKDPTMKSGEPESTNRSIRKIQNGLSGEVQLDQKTYRQRDPIHITVRFTSPFIPALCGQVGTIKPGIRGVLVLRRLVLEHFAGI
jgi:hypothetical protein